MPITDIFLEGGGRKDQLLSYHIDFDQRTDERSGKPVGRPSLSQFSIRIRRESEPAVSYYLNWQLDPTAQEDLAICFYDNHQLKRQIKIERAYLISYNQDNHEAGAIEETLVISPERVDIDEVSFDREDYR